MTEEQKQVERYIVIQATGELKIVGKWRIGELLGAADGLRQFAERIEFTPQPDQPATQA